MIEICPHCFKEQEIEEKLTPQVCPECGGRIMACSYCFEQGINCDFAWDDDTHTTGHCQFNREEAVPDE